MIKFRGYSSVLGRILGLIKEHRVRLIAGLVLVIGGIFIGVAPFMSRAIWIVLLSPLVFGACVPLLSSGRITDLVNGWKEEFSTGVEKARSNGSKEARYIVRPLHSTGLTICRLTGRVGSDHLKAGIRLTAILYFGMVILTLLAAVLAAWLFAVAATLAITAALWIFGSKGEDEFASEPRVDRTAPIRGRFYRGTSWLTDEMAGRIDGDGIIYRGTNWITQERIGRVAADGTIYKGASILNEEVVGHIDHDGTLYKGSNWFTQERAGRVTEDGIVYEGKSWLNEERVGRVDRE